MNPWLWSKQVRESAHLSADTGQPWLKKQAGLQAAVDVSAAKKEPGVEKEKRSELTMEADKVWKGI